MVKQLHATSALPIDNRTKILAELYLIKTSNFAQKSFTKTIHIYIYIYNIYIYYIYIYIYISE